MKTIAHRAAQLCGAMVLAGAALAPVPPSSGFDQEYAKEIHKQLDLFAAWEPTEPVACGDFGEMEGKVFKRLGNISKKFGIKLETKTYPDGPIDYTSSGDVSVDVDVGAKDSKGDNQIDIKVSLAKQNNVLLKADGVTIERIDNIGAVGDALVALYKEKGKDWKLSYVVVTEVKHAQSGCVIISKDSDCKVQLSGTAAVKQSGVKLGDVELRNVSASVTKGKAYTKTWSSTCTPLLQLHQVKDPVTKKAFFTEYK